MFTKHATKKFKTVSVPLLLWTWSDYLRNTESKLRIVHRSAHNATISRNTSPRKTLKDSSFDYENFNRRGWGDGKQDLLATSAIFSSPSYHLT